jgi:hypothetical protein
MSPTAHDARAVSEMRVDEVLRSESVPVREISNAYFRKFGQQLQLAT